jgi:hypothetical protein
VPLRQYRSPVLALCACAKLREQVILQRARASALLPLHYLRTPYTSSRNTSLLVDQNRHRKYLTVGLFRKCSRPEQTRETSLFGPDSNRYRAPRQYLRELFSSCLLQVFVSRRHLAHSCLARSGYNRRCSLRLFVNHVGTSSRCRFDHAVATPRCPWGERLRQGSAKRATIIRLIPWGEKCLPAWLLTMYFGGFGAILRERLSIRIETLSFRKTRLLRYCNPFANRGRILSNL